MSDRDKALIDALDINVVQLASIVNVSRQTVSNKISDAEFFNAPTLKKVYDFQCERGADSCAFTARAIEQYFDEFSKIVIGKSSSAQHDAKVTFGAGEYWFVCSDFNHFKANYSACFASLADVAHSEVATLVLFVSSTDKFRANRFRRQNSSGGVSVIECRRPVSPIPLLSKRTNSGGAEVYVPGVSGFFRALDFDATNVRAMVQEVFDDAEEDVSENSDRNEINA